MAEKTTFIKLDRNILQWRWYKDANVFRVFIYLLLTAAYRETETNGILLQRGQCLTTYKELANNNAISYDTVRTAFSKLKETGEITIERKLRKLLITLTKYELYQGHSNLTFFVDMRNDPNYFSEKSQLLFEKIPITKTLEKPLDTLQNPTLEQSSVPITLTKNPNYFDEKSQSKEERKEAKERRNNKDYISLLYKKNNILLLSSARVHEYINYIINLYNTICVDFPPVNVLTEPIIEELLNSLEIYGLEHFEKVFKKARSTPYLNGLNKHKMCAKFDWLINADNMAKILNGNYDDLASKNGSYDTDEFFEAALKKSYENTGRRKNE